MYQFLSIEDEIFEVKFTVDNAQFDQEFKRTEIQYSLFSRLFIYLTKEKNRYNKN